VRYRQRLANVAGRLEVFRSCKCATRGRSGWTETQVALVPRAPKLLPAEVGRNVKGFSGGERVSPKSTSSSGPAYLRALHRSRSRITRASGREAKVLPRVLGA
jgi:hypothetical protein